MSSLRSVIDELAGEDLASLPDGRAEEDFEELQHGIEALEAERLRRLADLRQRRIHEVDGHLSMASWLVARFRMAAGVAAQLVRVATALEGMPRTRRALADGAISPSSAQVLVSAHQVDPDAFATSEEVLVTAAGSLPVQQLQQAVEYWRMAADAREGVNRTEALHARRHLHVSATIFGVVRVDGTWTPRPARRS
jgi:hypothetical protein